MRHTLRCVDEDFCSGGVRGGDDFFQRVSNTQHVGGVNHTDEFRALKGVVKRLHVEGEVLGDGNITQLNASLLGEHLPRDDVGVVFHLGQDNGVAFCEVGSPPRVGDKVDAFCRTAGDDDLVRIEALLEFTPTGLVAFGRFPRQGVNRSVDVGVGLGVIIVHGVKNNLRLLGGRSVVKVDERVAVYLALKDGKLISECHVLTSSIRIQDAPSIGFAFHRQGLGAQGLRNRPA